MKRIIIILMTCILTIGSSVPFHVQNTICSAATKKASVKEVYKAYNKFMEKKKYEGRMSKQEIKQSKSYQIGYYVLDIDQNGVPELLVSVWDENYLTHQGNVYLYTYAGKKIKYIGKMCFADKKEHWITTSYNAKTKNIWLCDAHEGDAYFICYTYNGKALKKEKKYFIPYSEENRVSNMKKVEKIEKSAGRFINLYANSKSSRQKHLTFQLDKSNLTLTQSKKAKLKVTGKLSGLKWSSTNPKVATVKDGMVTAKKKGKAVIKARLSGSTVRCKVTVKALTKKQKAIKAYNKFMEKKKYEKNMTKKEIAQIRECEKSKESSSKGAGYYVLDVDKNGIPELLVIGADHSAIINPVYIYTYRGKKVTYIGRMKLSEKEMIASAGPSYNTKTKKLWMCSGDLDANYVCYKYDGKSIKREKKYYLPEDTDGTKEQEYQKVMKMVGKNIKFYNNTTKSRNKHLTF